MKIEGAAAFRVYKSYTAAVGSSANTDLPSGIKTENAGKTDKVSFSEQAAKNGELSRLTQSIAAELSMGTPSGRLRELKEAVADGGYQVPTEDLADAILSTWG